MTTLVDIVSSRVKAELLRLLFGLSQPELHLRELVRQTGLSLATLQQELRRLCRVGVVTARRDGNRVYYRSNPDHPIHRDLCSLVLKTDGLRNVLQEALSDPEIKTAFIFGSFARGEANAGSDVDLMVVGSISLRRLSSLLSSLSEKVGREINPHVMTLEELALRRKKRDHFVTSVLASEKILIKGTEDDLREMGR